MLINSIRARLASLNDRQRKKFLESITKLSLITCTAQVHISSFDNKVLSMLFSAPDHSCTLARKPIHELHAAALYLSENLDTKFDPNLDANISEHLDFHTYENLINGSVQAENHEGASMSKADLDLYLAAQVLMILRSDLILLQLQGAEDPIAEHEQQSTTQQHGTCSREKRKRGHEQEHITPLFTNTPPSLSPPVSPLSDTTTTSNSTCTDDHDQETAPATKKKHTDTENYNSRPKRPPEHGQLQGAHLNIFTRFGRRWRSPLFSPLHI